MSQNFLLNTILHTENFEAVCLNLSFKVKFCANNAAVNFLIFLGTGLIALKPVPKNLIQFWFRKYIITIFFAHLLEVINLRPAFGHGRLGHPQSLEYLIKFLGSDFRAMRPVPRKMRKFIAALLAQKFYFER